MTAAGAGAAPPPALVLASASPQRTAILTRLGVPHAVRPSGAAELAEGDAEHVAGENARRKALAVRAPAGALVLGADTVVALDDRVLGKPEDLAEARAHLRALAGRAHRVLGGVAMARDGALLTHFVDEAKVAFRPLDAALVEWYLACGEWRGRAGGYAIQGRGAALVARVEGDPLTVVGLPAARLLDRHPELLGGAVAAR